MPRGRLLRALTTSAVVALGGAFLLLGTQSGYRANHPRLLSGAAWLASSQVGQMALLDGSSGEIAAQVQVARPGERIDAVQRASTGYVVNNSAGTIRRVDGATFETSAPASPITGAKDGLLALAGRAALFVIDTDRAVLTGADPRTLAGRHGMTSVAADLSTDTARLDSHDRLWTLDRSTGDVIRIDGGQRHVSRGVARPGKASLILAGDAPVVIDPDSRTAIELDPRTGDVHGRRQIDIAPGDATRVSGSPRSDRLYLVTSLGLLTVCDLSATSCASAVLLGSKGNLGEPVESGQNLFIPDYTSGKVWIVDLKRSSVVAQADILTPQTQFQLLDRDGVVFFNDPDSERAGVIHLDGTVQRIPKYDPKDPTSGLTARSSATQSITRTPERTPATPQPQPPADQPTTAPPTPTPPATPPSETSSPPRSEQETPEPPRPPDQAEVQITLSKTTARVGEEVTLQASVTAGQTIREARWSFGDGQSGVGTSVDHHWTEARSFQVTVQASLSGGQVRSASATIQVIDRPRLILAVQGAGTVTGNGLTCPGNCDGTAEYGASVTLTATADAGSELAAWGGACSGQASTCTVVMDADRSVTADFRSTSLAAPVLVSPADNALFTHYPRTTTLTWQAVPGAASYNVEVQCDTCGSTPWTSWADVTVTSTSYDFTWVGDNHGRWRVTAISASGERGQASGFRQFSFKTAPSAPTLISPANGSVFNTFPRNTTLRWSPFAGATSYLLEVYCDVCGTTSWELFFQRTLTATSYPFEWVGAQSGRWRVTAIKADGSRSEPSATWEFRYTR